MKISVIIPTCGRPELLKKCLRALVAQSFPKADFEVLVVSDGPDAPVTEVLMAFTSSGLQLQHLQTQEKEGSAAARNRGWQSAKGTLLAFTDEDALPEPDWLLAYWQSYQGEILVVYTGKIIVPHSSRPVDSVRRIAKKEKADLALANCCCTRAVLVLADGFDERYSATWHADRDFYFRLLLQKIPIRYVSESVVVYPTQEAPWGSSMWEQRKAVFNALLYRKFPGLYHRYISSRRLLYYYAIVLSAFKALVALGLPNRALLGYACMAVWLLLTLAFIVRRLWHTSLTLSHVMEMIVTSFVVPFASVYWHLRGAWRYRVLFF